MIQHMTFEVVMRPGVEMHNVVVWHDNTARPWRGHHNCNGRWKYDGQVFYHPSHT